MADFDSSDDEFEMNRENLEPLDDLRVDWVNVGRLGLCNTLALSSLPGCRYHFSGFLIPTPIGAVVNLFYL